VASGAQTVDCESSPIPALSDRGRLGVAAALYVLAGAVLSVWLGTWTDEEYTLATTAHGVAFAVAHAVGYELQAPLYFALLGAWRHLDSAVWFARLFSVLCGAGTLVAFAAIGRRIAPRVNPLGFALWAGLNPFTVRGALEIRHYALALLLSALLWLAFDAGFFSGSRRDARVAFVALAIAGIYTQYFIAFALVGFALSLLILKRRTLGTYVACAALVVVAVLPLAFSARGQGAWFAAEAPPPVRIVRWTLIHPWLGFVFPFDWQWDEFRFVHAAYTALVCALGVLVVLCRPVLTRRNVALIAGALSIELLYVLMATVLHFELSERYFVALYVPVAVAVYGIWDALAEERPRAGFVVLSTSALLAAAVLFSQYRYLAQPGDWKRVAAYLSDRARPPDAIAVYQPDALPAFLREYHGDVAVIPYPRAPSPKRYTIAAVSVASVAEARSAFAVFGSHRRIWFVEDGKCDVRQPLYGCEYVERAIAASFAVRSTQRFYDNRVEELVPLRLPALRSGTGAEGSRQPQAQRRRNVGVARQQHVAQPRTGELSEERDLHGIRRHVGDRIG